MFCNFKKNFVISGVKTRRFRKKFIKKGFACGKIALTHTIRISRFYRYEFFPTFFHL